MPVKFFAWKKLFLDAQQKERSTPIEAVQEKKYLILLSFSLSFDVFIFVLCVLKPPLCATTLLNDRSRC
jgi:hypothetical protein